MLTQYQRIVDVPRYPVTESASARMAQTCTAPIFLRRSLVGCTVRFETVARMAFARVSVPPARSPTPERAFYRSPRHKTPTINSGFPSVQIRCF